MAVALLLVPAEVAGQELAPEGQFVPLGLRVRVQMVDSSLVWGLLHELHDDDVLLSQTDREEFEIIAREDVLKMWWDDGDHIWLGGAVGGAVGVVIGHLYARQFEPSPADFGVPILGGVAGFAAGFAIGAMVTKWVPFPL